jgi:hypothetical protein
LGLGLTLQSPLFCCHSLSKWLCSWRLTILTISSTHPIQVAWTSRNAGSVQNRTVSAS